MTLTRTSHASLLAIAAAITAALSPSAAAQIPTAELIDLPMQSSGLDNIYSLAGDASGSWVSMGTTQGLNGNPNVIYGVLAGSGTSAPGILRTAETTAGVEQDQLFFPRVRGDDVSYVSAVELPNGTFQNSAWINDTEIARTGDAIGTNQEWAGFRTPVLTAGDTFLRGFTRVAGSQDPLEQIIVRFPSMDVVYSSTAPLPGVSGPVIAIQAFDASPSGEHWTATIVYTSTATQETEYAVLLDGAVFMISGTTPLTTENVGTSYLGRSFVDDSGLVTYAAAGQGNALDIYRNDWVLQSIDSGVLDMDARGRLLGSIGAINYGVGVSVDGVFLDRPGAGGLDANGDGAVNTGWAVLPDSFGNFVEAATFIDQGQVLVIRPVQVPGAGTQPGIVKAKLALPDLSICPGVTNGVGLEGTLRVLGSDIASFNDIELHMTNLPPQTPMLPLFSRTQGFVANPGGSTGNLCLGGSIGRGFAAASSFVQLNFTLRAYPSQLPQPNGPVAAQPGETWYFQTWYRDTQTFGNSNFTNAVAVTFQ